jgi:hypothetical protein
MVVPRSIADENTCVELMGSKCSVSFWTARRQNYTAVREVRTRLNRRWQVESFKLPTAPAAWSPT